MKYLIRRAPVVLFGSAVAAVTAAAAYAHWIERKRVGLAFYTVRVDRPEIRDGGLPAGGLTILHLSDFHFRAEDRVQAARIARLKRLLAGRPYDILALTGDLIHDQEGLPAALDFLRELRPRLGAYTVPGNRDYWKSSFSAVLGLPRDRADLTLYQRIRYVAGNVRRTWYMFTHNQRARLRIQANDVSVMHTALAAQGIEPLLNRAVQVHDLDGVWIAGVDEYGAERAHEELDPGATLSQIPGDAVLVLLSHNPDVWLHPAAQRADLILAGHTHGGQIVAPGAGALYRQGTHLARRKAAGWFESGRSVMFVTRGLGESFPFRFGAPPEAAIIRLVPGNAGKKEERPLRKERTGEAGVYWSY